MGNDHHHHERRQLVWLFVSFGLIALMVIGVMIFGGVQAGLWGQ